MKTKENITIEENATQPAFVPQKIGEEKSFTATGLKVFYDNLLQACTGLKNQLQTCLKTQIPIDEFLSFLKSNPEKWIYSKYIDINNIKFNGLSNEKIIELKMLDIVGVDEVLSYYASFQNVLAKMGDNKFYFPLRKLFFEEEDIFHSTGELWEEIDNRFTIFTKTEEQNRVLDVFNRLCSILNELEELNILRAKNGPTEIEMLSDYLKFGNTTNSAFTVNPQLFSQHRLSGYKTKFQLNPQKSINELFF